MPDAFFRFLSSTRPARSPQAAKSFRQKGRSSDSPRFRAFPRSFFFRIAVTFPENADGLCAHTLRRGLQQRELSPTFTAFPFNPGIPGTVCRDKGKNYSSKKNVFFTLSEKISLSARQSLLDATLCHTHAARMQHSATHTPPRMQYSATHTPPRMQHSATHTTPRMQHSVFLL